MNDSIPLWLIIHLFLLVFIHHCLGISYIITSVSPIILCPPISLYPLPTTYLSQVQVLPKKKKKKIPDFPSLIATHAGTRAALYCVHAIQSKTKNSIFMSGRYCFPGDIHYHWLLESFWPPLPWWSLNLQGGNVTEMSYLELNSQQSHSLHTDQL